MLLHQAVRGFQLWFGVRPEVTEELRALVEADLAGTNLNVTDLTNAGLIETDLTETGLVETDPLK
jgi:uncharacterized protein YjbI with pentapeptide repeats